MVDGLVVPEQLVRVRGRARVGLGLGLVGVRVGWG